MTSKQYKLARRYRGTAVEVAAKLGIHKASLDKRERGGVPISREAELALLALPVAEKIAPIPKSGPKPKPKAK